MRIGVITTSYPREPGDPAGNFVAAHVDWLRASGHRVDVICAAHGREPHEAWQPDVSITAVPAPAWLFYAGGAPDSLDAALASRAGLGRAARGAGMFCAALAGAVARQARRWDGMVAHWLIPSAAIAALAPTTAPVVAIAHSGDVHLARRLGITAPLAGLLAARRARVAFVSEDLRRRFLTRVWPGRLRDGLARGSLVTPMGLHTARFRRLRARRDEPGEPRHVVFLGRLVAIKGARMLLEAMGELEAMGGRGRVRVTVAGHGPDRAALERRARGLRTVVHFAGEVRGDQRDALLARADLLVAPSIAVAHDRTEGMPMAVLEAMAAGVPVIASRTGGLAELPETTAMLVRPGDARALAAAIRQCLADPAGCASRVDAAARFVDRLDWQHVGALLAPLPDD